MFVCGRLNEGDMVAYYENSDEEMEQIKDSRNRHGKELGFIAVMTLYSFTICYLVFMNIAVFLLKYGCKPFHGVQNRAQRVNESNQAN
ncbi:unnamed protein product [Toxocara canis]|uniref:Uncharacterized protein n=1 Tax=Toxocara canis TaxID=6265 RepID=A0A183TVI3_TOXCA|nr:unnamed protein product [Toxocara canis]